MFCPSKLTLATRKLQGQRVCILTAVRLRLDGCASEPFPHHDKGLSAVPFDMQPQMLKFGSSGCYRETH